jgi:hypothetical protein
MLTIQAKMLCKQFEFDLDYCIVEKVIELPAAQFDALVRQPLQTQGFIVDNRDHMWNDSDGRHCLMVMGEGRDDAILIESQGYDYARYSAYVAGGKVLYERSMAQTMEYGANPVPPPSVVGTPVSETTKALWQKMLANLTAFKREWKAQSPAWLIAHAEQIAATKQAFGDIPAYASEQHMAYLIQFQNPLEVVRDAYVNQIGFDREADLVCSVDYMMEKGSAVYNYDLDYAYTEPAQTNGMEVTQG